MRFARSAERHGISQADAEFALEHYVRAFAAEGDLEVTMFIGPSREGRLLEVGVLSDDDGDRVVHVMPARAKYLRAL